MTVPIGLAIASTAITAGSKIAGGIANKRAADYQAGVMELNKQVADQNAERATQVGQVAQQEQDFEALSFIGKQFALQGANGTEVSSGSAMKARATSQRLARLDAARIREDAQLTARQYRMQGLGLATQAQLARREGRQSLVAGFIGAGSSLISGAQRVAGMKAYSTTPFSTLVA